MDIQENKSQSSQDDGKEFGDDDIIGRMEIDDASDMTEVAGILLHLNVIFVLPTIAQQVMIHVSTFVIQAWRGCVGFWPPTIHIESFPHQTAA